MELNNSELMMVLHALKVSRKNEEHKLCIEENKENETENIEEIMLKQYIEKLTKLIIRVNEDIQDSEYYGIYDVQEY